MRVDATESVYQEAENVRRLFSSRDLKRCRILLRRLRFLESQMRSHAEAGSQSSDGALWAAREAEALEWILYWVGFLAETRVAPGVLTGSR